MLDSVARLWLVLRHPSDGNERFVLTGFPAEYAEAPVHVNDCNLKTLCNSGVHIGFATDSFAFLVHIPGFAI
jgi:hypothetical protein